MAYIQIEVEPLKSDPNSWTVEAIDEDGGIEQTIFAGPCSEGRAKNYARVYYRWKELVS